MWLIQCKVDNGWNIGPRLFGRRDYNVCPLTELMHACGLIKTTYENAMHVHHMKNTTAKVVFFRRKGWDGLVTSQDAPWKLSHQSLSLRLFKFKTARQATQEIDQPDARRHRAPYRYRRAQSVWLWCLAYSQPSGEGEGKKSPEHLSQVGQVYQINICRYLKIYSLLHKHIFKGIFFLHLHISK